MTLSASTGRPGRGIVLVACGLAAEAKIARGADTLVVAGGGDAARLERELRAGAARAVALLSFGVAGGLAPDLKAGDMRVAAAVRDPQGRVFAADPRWHQALTSRLGCPEDTLFAAVDAPLADVAGKAALNRATGAAVVDMESHVAARVATDLGLPFAAVRIVTDSARHALPPAAAVGMKPDGGIDAAAIARSILRQPGQIPALVRTGRDAKAAFASLLRCRQLLGPAFAFFDLVEPVLDVT